MSDATAPRTAVKTHHRFSGGSSRARELTQLYDADMTPLVARILDESDGETLNVQSYQGLPEFTDVDAASLVACLRLRPHTPITTLYVSTHSVIGYELRPNHAVAIIDACATLNTINSVWCSVHPRDKMDDHAAALARWLRCAERPPHHVSLQWNSNDFPALSVDSAQPMSDAAAADLFRASADVHLTVRRGQCLIDVLPRDRATAQVGAGTAAPAEPPNFASRLVSAALELSGGVSFLTMEAACIEDDAAALLDRLQRFGSSVRRLDFEDYGRALLESPAFHALVQTLPNLRKLNVKNKETARPETVRRLAAAVRASKTLDEVNLSGIGIASESCGAWHDVLTHAPALSRLTIAENDFTDADCQLLLRGVAFSRNACSFYIFGVRAGLRLSVDAAQKAAEARLVSAARFTVFAGAEKFCDAKSPARRFLEGDGDRAIAWRVLRLLGVQP